MGQRVPHILRAHPRSRGEHLSPVWWNSCTVGSSPLARGTRLHIERHALGHGLIPARAGNTPLCVRWACPSWAHPRSRGEHTSAAAGSSPVRGSSPLARGTQVRQSLQAGLVGLIPARAGNTGAPVVAGWFGWAHPRSRGEHPHAPSLELDAPGSSPLARGTPLGVELNKIFSGLIPARAGNTFQTLPRPPASRAHPRSRGEHAEGTASRAAVAGSSPLARGTLATNLFGALHPGLIPARAGNTNTFLPCFPSPGAHPRSRGEHLDSF